MQEAVGFFICLAIAISIGLIVSLFFITVEFVLTAIQDAWGEVVRHFRGVSDDRRNGTSEDAERR